MEKKNKKLRKIFKYLGKTLSYTLLTILIVIGLALLFVFITTKIAQSKGQNSPVNLYTIISPSMEPNIKVYDVVVAVKTDVSKLKVNDVISFYTDSVDVNGLSITHRIAEISKVNDTYLFKTKGDNNKYIDKWVVESEDVIGKVYFKVPQLGKIQFFIGSKGGWILAILIPALGIIAYDIFKIFKLIVIKKKINDYQKQEDIPENSKIDTISSIKDIEEDIDIQEEKHKVETEDYFYKSEEKKDNDEYRQINESFDEEISRLNRWKSKIEEKDDQK